MAGTESLTLGRDAFTRRAWAEAHAKLARAMSENPLSLDDLELLADAAFLIGRDVENVELSARVYRGHLAAGDDESAARRAFWLGFQLANAGEPAMADGWFGRSRRLVADRQSVVAGFLLLPAAMAQLGAGAAAEALVAFREAARIADSFGDPELLALAQLGQGHAQILCGEELAGLAILDELLVTLAAGELTPLVTGIAYCGALLACRACFEVDRARAWTAALERWCRPQPGLVSFRGSCRVHRAELLLIEGAWDACLAEATGAETIFGSRFEPEAAAMAAYLLVEVHRLRGDLSAAEAHYVSCSGYGGDPQPGLAMLRWQQGRLASATTAVARSLAERTAPLARAALLPAYSEMLLAAGDLDSARTATDELTRIAASSSSVWLRAAAGQRRAAVLLATGSPERAVVELRNALAGWRSIGAVYQAASTQSQLAVACVALGDEETARVARDSAASALDSLGAIRPATARVTALLSARECEVIRRVAAGARNQAIAEALTISPHTVARHLQNIFVKLEVASRTAAVARARERGLI